MHIFSHLHTYAHMQLCWNEQHFQVDHTESVWTGHHSTRNAISLWPMAITRWCGDTRSLQRWFTFLHILDLQFQQTRIKHTKTHPATTKHGTTPTQHTNSQSAHQPTSAHAQLTHFKQTSPKCLACPPYPCTIRAHLVFLYHFLKTRNR